MSSFFKILRSASGVAVALSQATAGLAAAGLNGLIGFSFRDSNGNLVLPQLDSNGRLPVSQESPGTMSAFLDTHLFTAAAVFEEAGDFPLTDSEIYMLMKFQANSCAYVNWEVRTHDGTADVATIARFATGPGTNQICCPVICEDIIAATGSIESLKVYAKQDADAALETVSFNACMLQKA